MDAVMLGLRTADGLDLAALRRRYGGACVEKMLPVLRRHAAAGLVELRMVAAPAAGGPGEAANAAAAAAGTAGGAAAAAAGGLRGQGGAAAPGGGDVVSARLTDPNGFLVSNDIISDVFAAL